MIKDNFGGILIRFFQKGSEMKRIMFLALSLLVIACSSDTKDNMTLSARGSYSSGLGKASSHVSIDTAKVLVTRIKLNATGGGADQEYRSGPYVIFLSDTNVHEITAGDVPHGTYTQVKFEIHKPGQNESVPDPDFREGPSGDQRYSMVIIGHYQGNRFVFKSRNTINQSLTIDPAIVIDDSIGVANLTLNVDYDSWFSNGGNDLDPTDTTSSNVSAIENSIKDAFRAYRDDDRDGNDD